MRRRSADGLAWKRDVGADRSHDAMRPRQDARQHIDGHFDGTFGWRSDAIDGATGVISFIRFGSLHEVQRPVGLLTDVRMRFQIKR